MKVGRKPKYPEKTPGDDLQKMSHAKARRFKPQARLEPAPQHLWQARKTDVQTVTPMRVPKHFPTSHNNDNTVLSGGRTKGVVCVYKLIYNCKSYITNIRDGLLEAQSGR